LVVFGGDWVDNRWVVGYSGWFGASGFGGRRPDTDLAVGCDAHALCMHSQWGEVLAKLRFSFTEIPDSDGRRGGGIEICVWEEGPFKDHRKTPFISQRLLPSECFNVFEYILVDDDVVSLLGARAGTVYPPD